MTLPKAPLTPALQSTLQELFPGTWGEQQPKTLVDLFNADYEDLDETARKLRKMTVTVVHSFERDPVHTPGKARELLEKHHLPARSGMWTAIVLDEGRERVYVRKKGSGMRLLHVRTKHFPTIDTLETDAPLPPNGAYLLVHGGGPQALTDENLAGYRELRKVATIVDVLLWDESDDAATFWSVKTGKGSRGREILDFPDPDTIKRWQS